MNEKAILAIIRDITERRETEQKILEAIITTQENEQRRYARELHDGIGPLLSTLKMYVEWLGNPELPNSNQIFTAALQTIDETIRQAKNLANRMSPHILERFGLVHALTEYLEKIKHATNINYQLTIPTSLKLPPSTEMALYRIFMEAIHNTLKYAAASNIFIEIKSENAGISVTYKDNGKGFDYEKATIESKGMGLFNIQNRVKILHGQCKFHSEPNKGFAMEIFLPPVE
jgi:signal transduction histidine kinase